MRAPHRGIASSGVRQNALPMSCRRGSTQVRQTALLLCPLIFLAHWTRSSIESYRSSRSVAFSEPIMNPRRFVGTSAFRVLLMRRRHHLMLVSRLREADMLTGRLAIDRIYSFSGSLELLPLFPVA